MIRRCKAQKINALKKDLLRQGQQAEIAAAAVFISLRKNFRLVIEPVEIIAHFVNVRADLMRGKLTV